MANFKFKFEAILKLKEQLENSIKNELAKATHLLNIEIEKLEGLENNKEIIIQEMKNVSVKITVGKLREFSTYIEYLEKKIEEQKNIVNHARENVDKIRERLIEAKKEYEVYKKLKEKKFQEYLAEEDRLERRFVDEVISYKQNIRNTEDEGT